LIQCHITEILHKKFGVSDKLLIARNWDEPLTGNLFRFSGVDLAYLFFELELVFEMRITSHYLDSYGFCSINSIAEIIRRCITYPQSC
jgi:hypothetical protein